MKGQVSELKNILLVLIALAVLIGIIFVLSGKSSVLIDRIKDLLTFGL
jgi:hypothetical protein